MTDKILIAFWKKYIAADDLKRTKILKTKTLIGKLHKTVAIMPDDNMKQHVVLSEVQSYIDDLIEYYEAKHGKK